ncbi:MAG: hypothetical protein HKN56_05455 [Gammaproteobacteria bacterium]|nr:hypothetical protein [Gammaproteobacteria bacterium]
MKTLVTPTIGIVSAFLSMPVSADNHSLPEPTNGEFCQAAQRILASTEMSGTVEVFDNMPDYRASKPAPDPLLIYQVVTYNQAQPVAVSCKVKAADHLRAAYGESAAGEQLRCAAIANKLQEQAVRELEAEGLTEAAAAARNFIVDDEDPYATGREYLASFQLSYRDPEGRIHISSPGLQTDWENWLFYLLPDRVRGQTYCHLATVSYLKSLATGAMEPGLMITTADDAPTTPSSATAQ